MERSLGRIEGEASAGQCETETRRCCLALETVSAVAWAMSLGEVSAESMIAYSFLIAPSSIPLAVRNFQPECFEPNKHRNGRRRFASPGAVASYQPPWASDCAFDVLRGIYSLFELECIGESFDDASLVGFDPRRTSTLRLCLASGARTSISLLKAESKHPVSICVYAGIHALARIARASTPLDSTQYLHPLAIQSSIINDPLSRFRG